ncbi:MAG: glycosyltransferase family 9 protein [Candidatus Omnitrophica bacterium]|nr:glycosyltransferase family 9 protein [Candidatus Omnitrophota bacterium]MBU1784326.1 glycosyltransferase family 9 protein [Candidatus Omnitrophota bacterium]
MTMSAGKIDKSLVKTILFVSLSNLGDIILTTPVLQKLAGEFPFASIDVICGTPGEDIFSKHPAVREIIVTKKHRSFASRMRDMGRLRKKHYDMVVDLKLTLMPFFLNTPFRAGGFLPVTRRSNEPLQTPRAESPGSRARVHTEAAFSDPVVNGGVSRRRMYKPAVWHKREEHLSRIIALGIDIADPDFFVPVTIYDCRFVDEILKGSGDKNIVLLNPGSKSHLKRWDAAKYAELSDRLVEELGCQVLVAGNKDDREVIDLVLSRVKAPVKNICGRTTIGELLELMRRVSLVITNDSAPLHMASAVNAPTIAIFGPSDDRKYGPLAERNMVLKPKVACSPCEKALCHAGPEAGCISRVSVEEVFQATKEMLG